MTYSGYDHCQACRQQDIVQKAQVVNLPYKAPWADDLLNAQLKASHELETFRQNSNQRAIETLVNLYTARIDELQEQLEYEKLKNDAYRMVWSAREYMRTSLLPVGISGSGYTATYRILTNALNTLEAERVDGMAIREKYNPKVVKLTKKPYLPETGFRLKYAQPDADVFDRDDWHKYWKAVDEVFSLPADKRYYYPDPESTIDDGRNKGPKC